MDAPVGAPPTLEWIAVDRLAIDETYQRATDGPRSRSLIYRISERWNWNYCQPLVVSRRVDGSLYVIDGQHRLSAALKRGDIPHLPCVVITGANATDEAASFVALNTHRQKLSQGDVFNAMLAAGDEKAKHVAEILRETGWRMTRTSNTQAWKPGELFCGPALVRDLARFGDKVVRNGLACLREAYPDTPVTCTVTILRALFYIYRDKLVDDPDLLVEVIGSCSPDDWLIERHEQRILSPQISLDDALVVGIVATCREAKIDKAIAA